MNNLEKLNKTISSFVDYEEKRTRTIRLKEIGKHDFSVYKKYFTTLIETVRDMFIKKCLEDNIDIDDMQPEKFLVYYGNFLTYLKKEFKDNKNITTALNISIAFVNYMSKNLLQNIITEIAIDMYKINNNTLKTLH